MPTRFFWETQLSYQDLPEEHPRWQKPRRQRQGGRSTVITHLEGDQSFWLEHGWGLLLFSGRKGAVQGLSLGERCALRAVF